MIARAQQNDFSRRLDHYRERVNDKLARTLRENQETPASLLEAMQYSVLGPGKRIRPLLAYASAELCGTDEEAVDSIAAAVEMIHAYSLIHDDLPAMDDDDLRRGKPTTHRAFDEATAILAGDALQALAFETLCRDGRLRQQPEALAAVLQRLARAAGPTGMVGGQILDMEAEARNLSESELEEVHRLKTGELIRAAIMMPCELSGFDEGQRDKLDVFASEIGLVFQIRDDLLEVEQDTQTLGKSSGSDQSNEKSTYPKLLGVQGARARADEIYKKATDALSALGDGAGGLLWMSDFILERSY